jgi:hypothetical protein
MNRDPTLCRSFVRQAKQALSHHPQIVHKWSIDDDEDHCILDISEADENGFPITVEVHSEQITVMAGPTHVHLDLDGDADELAAYALGLVRDLLSPATRIHERLAGKTPIKWTLEHLQGGEWTAEEEMGLLLYNYFGRRSERTYQNQILPAREEPVT